MYVRLHICSSLIDLLFFDLNVGLRGCTADVIILEEAAHMNPDVFRQVVVPLMGVGGTAILAISTPDDEFNYYSKQTHTMTFRSAFLLFVFFCLYSGVDGNV